MPLIDDRGRVFGRFNLIDAVVLVFVIGLIPLIYGAAVLFWQPQPTLTAVEPTTLMSGPNMRIKIRGEHLKPYMRVSVGNIQGKDYLFRSTTEAEINLNEMAPGTYDVVLFDVSQERARLPQALTITPQVPPTRMTLVGIFGNLDAPRAAMLTPGTVMENLGIIRRVGQPIPARMRVQAAPVFVQLPVDKAVMLPAEVEANCDIRMISGTPLCQANGINLQPTMVVFGDHNAAGHLPFQIDQLRAVLALETITATVRISAAAAVLAAMREGDVDHGLYANPLAAGATIARIVSRQGDIAEVVLTVPAERGTAGWQYASAPIRAGAPLAFRTPRYEVLGTVLTLSPEWTPSQ